jgi:hypothetical protein
MQVNLATIYSTGVIDPYYHDLFYIPIFLDTAPITWDNLESTVLGQGTYLSMLFTTVEDHEETYSEDNSTMSAYCSHSAYFLISADPLVDMDMNCTTAFSYDMNTGILLESKAHVYIEGNYDDDVFSIKSDYHIEKTDISDFMEFFIANKWYFAGGGAGLIVIVGTIMVLVIRRKRRR